MFILVILIHEPITRSIFTRKQKIKFTQKNEHRIQLIINYRGSGFKLYQKQFQLKEETIHWMREDYNLIWKSKSKQVDGTETRCFAVNFFCLPISEACFAFMVEAYIKVSYNNIERVSWKEKQFDTQLHIFDHTIIRYILNCIGVVKYLCGQKWLYRENYFPVINEKSNRVTSERKVMKHIQWF